MLYKDFLQKIENKEVFSEKEIERFFDGTLLDDEDDLDIREVSYVEGECQRWSHTDERVWFINGRYFMVYGEIGNTEYQDNYFFEAPFEVTPIKKVITTTITNYVPV